mgnify:CR=1 FL=1
MFKISTSGKDCVGVSEDIVFPHEFGHSFGILHDEYPFTTGMFGFASETAILSNYDNCGMVDFSEGKACDWCNGIKDINQLKSIPCDTTTFSPDDKFLQEYGTQFSFTIEIARMAWNNINAAERCIRIGPICAFYRDGFSGIQPPKEFMDDPHHCRNSIVECSKYSSTEEECKNVKWVSGEACKWVSEKDPFFNSNCIPKNKLDNIDIGVGCEDDTGCYGICGYRNWFRSSKYSIMAGWQNKPFDTFNYVQQKILCNKLKEKIGSAGGICSTNFEVA